MKGRQWKSMRSCFKTLILTIWQHIISGKGKQGGTNFLMVKLEALQWTIQSKMYGKEEHVVTVRSSRHTAQEEPNGQESSHPLPLKKARSLFQFCFCTPCQGSQSIGLRVTEVWMRLHTEMSLLVPDQDKLKSPNSNSCHMCTTCQTTVPGVMQSNSEKNLFALTELSFCWGRLHASKEQNFKYWRVLWKESRTKYIGALGGSVE